MDELSFYYLFGKFAVVGAFLGFSAIFSSFETAFFSISEGEDKELSADKVLAKMWQYPKEVLVNILIGNTLVNILASIFATSLILDLCLLFNLGTSYGITLAIILMTIIIIIWGEIIPKTFAIKNSKILVKLTKSFIHYFSYLVTPLRIILLFITNIFIGREEVKEKITEEEVKTLFDLGKKEGLIKEEERRMLYKIFEFSKVEVKKVMVPKDKIVCVSIEDTLEKVLEVIKRSGFSRIPVYKENRSNIIGIVYAKDLIKYFGKHKSIGIDSFMREIYFVPELKKVNQLFYEFQERKTQMALVINSEGIITGLVTMEDLIEEVVGEIKDEFDRI